MSGISANATSTFVELPQFDAIVHRARQEQMARLGKQLNLLYAFGVARVRVNALFGNVAFGGQIIAQQVDVQILRNVQERTTHVVDRVVDMQRRLALVVVVLVALLLTIALVAAAFGEQFVEAGALLVAGLGHLLLVFVRRPRTQIAVHVGRIVVARLLAFRVRRLLAFLVRCHEQVVALGRLVVALEVLGHDESIVGIHARVVGDALVDERLALVLEMKVVEVGLLHVAGERVLGALVEVRDVRVVGSEARRPQILVARVVRELFAIVRHVCVHRLVFL